MKESAGMLFNNVSQSVSKGFIKTIILFVIFLTPPCLFMGTLLATASSLGEANITLIYEASTVSTKELNNKLASQEQNNNYYSLAKYLLFFSVVEAAYRCICYISIYVFNFTGTCELCRQVYGHQHSYSMLDAVLSFLHGGILVILISIIVHT